MQTCMSFTFNGITSEDMDVLNVFDGSGETIIASARTPVISKAINGSANIINRIDIEPLSFELQIMPKNASFTPEFINTLYKWFDVDDYKKLSFADDPDFYYRVLPFTEHSKATLYSGNHGFFPVSFTCDSGHGYTDITKTINLQHNENITIEIPNMNGILNNGSYSVPLFISAKFDGNGGDSFRIKSSASSEIFTVSNTLSGLKQIDIDAESGIIICDNGSNGYELCSGLDGLSINGNTSNSVLVTNNSNKSFDITIVASIPLMGYKNAEWKIEC